MAVRGAKPKPAHLKLIEGNPGKRPIVPDPAADLPATHDNVNRRWILTPDRRPRLTPPWRCGVIRAAAQRGAFIPRSA